MSIETKETPNGLRYRVRYRSPDGKSRERWFRRKAEAVRFETEIRDAMYRGAYVDPRAGRKPFRELAEQWRTNAMHKPTTAVAVESRLRLHVYPAIGDRPIASIRPSDVQGLVKGLTLKLKPGTIEIIYRHVVSVFQKAVADNILAKSPCTGISLPKNDRPKVKPISLATYQGIAHTISPRFQAIVTTAAGTGMRQGELFGLKLDRIDFLKRTITVDEQIQLLDGSPTATTPKTAASCRVIPVPQAVLDTINRHIAQYGLGPDGLVFTGRTGKPIRRNSFHSVWAPVKKKLGLTKGSGLHLLRHFYASMLIRSGASVKVVQARLGHASAMETLDTYGHLWEDDDDRTREAVDEFLAAAQIADHASDGEADAPSEAA